jgi:hypothetical protein
MSNKYLDGYVDVPTRLRLALEKYPDLRVQESGYTIVQVDDKKFLVCEVDVYTTLDDPRPVSGSAWEPLPGLTPYTRNSELMVGMTSALGRALGYLGFGIDRSIASANEVEARMSDDRTDEPTEAPQTPRRAALGSKMDQAVTDGQKRFLKALGHSGLIPETKADAARLIDKLKGNQDREVPF